tara:strand:+ start:132 stop:305 length:174 start_codon:yes stop_codon:yes gene_type:complete
MYFLGFFFFWGEGFPGLDSIPHIYPYNPYTYIKMAPTVPEFKAFKGFADISQSLEAI